MREPPTRAHHVPQTHVYIYIYITPKNLKDYPTRKSELSQVAACNKGFTMMAPFLSLHSTAAFLLIFSMRPEKIEKKSSGVIKRG